MTNTESRVLAQRSSTQEVALASRSPRPLATATAATGATRLGCRSFRHPRLRAACVATATRQSDSVATATRYRDSRDRGELYETKAENSGFGGQGGRKSIFHNHAGEEKRKMPAQPTEARNE